MKKLILTLLLSVLANSNSVAEVVSTSEKVNPFNEDFNPHDGLNLLSGDVAYKYPIYTLRGRDDLSIDLVLKYSSNVNTNARACNDIAPTGWVGLGWSIGFGKITSDHKGTMTTKDDEYFWISPEGVMCKIIKDGPYYNLENNPYWKITNVTYGSGNNYIRYWKLISPEGKIFIYGDMQYNANSTWYTYCFESSKHVGMGWCSTPSLYPFQWDLYSIGDQNGNTITFEYTQTKEETRPFPGGPKYTKASYLKKINSPGTGWIEFKLSKKDPQEFYDPKRLVSEPDYDMELFEDSILSEVVIYNSESAILKKLHFEYGKKLDLYPGFHYQKSLLTAVRDELEYVQYSYYDSSASNDANYNFGALRNVKNSRCNEIEYKYELKKITGCDLGGKIGDKNPSGYGRIGETEYCFFDQGKYAEVRYLGDGLWETKRLYPAFMAGMRYQNLGIDSLTPVTWFKAYAGTDYIILYYETPVSSFIDTWRWNGQAWYLSQSIPVSTVDAGNQDDRDIKVGNDFFLLKGKNNGIGFLKAYNWIRNGQGQWCWKDTCVNLNYNDNTIEMGGSFFVTWKSCTNCYQVYRWNGESWEKQQICRVHDGVKGVWAHSDYFAVFYQKRRKEYVFAYKFNGDLWQPAVGNSDNDRIEKCDRMQITTGDDFFVIRHPSLEKISAYNWNGRKWFRTLDAKKDLRGPFDFNTGKKFFAVTYSVLEWRDDNIGERKRDAVMAFRYNEKRSDWDTKDFGDAELGKTKEDHNFFKKLFGYTGGIFADLIVLVSRGSHSIDDSDFEYVKKVHDIPLSDDKDLSKAVSVSGDLLTIGSARGVRGIKWNGFEWKSPFRLDFTARYFGINNDLTTCEWTSCGSGESDIVPAHVAKPGLKVINKSAFIIGKITDNNSHKEYTNIVVERDFRDLFGLRIPYTFACTEKQINDGFSGNEIKINIDYKEGIDKGEYDLNNNSAEFNRVKIIYPDNSKLINNYNVNALLKERYFDGEKIDDCFLSGIQNLNSSDEPVQERKFDYKLLSGFQRNVRFLRLTADTTVRENVTSYKNIEYIDNTGEPRKIEEVNSDGTKKITRFEYAHEQYTDMIESNMVSSPLKKEIYEGNISNSKENIRSVDLMTWKKQGQQWYPSKNFTWNVAMDTCGKPLEDFTPFDFSYSATNPKWKLNNQFTIYDNYGNLLEVLNNKNVANSTIFRNNGLLPIAKVVNNSIFNNCKVLTGDYQGKNLPSGYFEDQWCKGNSELSNQMSLFGQKSIFVEGTDSGPYLSTQSFIGDNDFIFSAWVCPIMDSTEIDLDIIIYRPGETSGTKIAGGTSIALKAKKWVRISRTVTTGQFDHFALNVRPHNSRSFFVNDIRFHPRNAFLNTIYYDTLWNKPISVVDEYGNCNKSEFDKFGREIKTFKISNGIKQLVTEKEYNMACGLETILPRIKNLTVSYDPEFPFDEETFSYSSNIDNSFTNITLTPFTETGVKVYYGTLEISSGRPINIDLAQNSPAAINLKAVAPNGMEQTYLLTITRKNTCWSYVGSPGVSQSKADFPQIAFLSGAPYVFYADDDTLKAKKYSGTVWTDAGTNGLINTSFAGDISSCSNGGNLYVAYSADQLISDDEVFYEKRAFVAKWSGTSWTPVPFAGSSVSKGQISTLSLAVSSSGIPFVAYEGDKNGEMNIVDTINVYNRVYVKRWNQSTNTWVLCSDYDGLSGEGGSHISIAVSSTDEPYVAYVYRDDDDIPEGSDESSKDTLHGRIFVKRGVWNGSSYVWSTLGTPFNGNNATNVVFTIDGNTPYIAFSNPKEGYKVSVLSFQNGSWISLPEPLINAETDGTLKIVAKNNVVYLSCMQQNQNNIMLIKYENGNWSSVGNSVTTGSSIGKYSFGIDADFPYLAYQDDFNGLAISVIRFDQNGCPDATLQTLTISNGSLAPEFKSYLTEYQAEVEYSISMITVTAIPNNMQALVYINGKLNQNEISLQVGKNTINVAVVTSDGTKKTYKNSVYRLASRYAEFCDLQLMDKNKNAMSLSLPFSQTNYEYTAQAGQSLDSVYIRARANGNVHLYINNVLSNEFVIDDYSKPIPLNYGDNVISASAVAKDRISHKDYFFIIHREIPNILTLQNISVNGTTVYDFSPQKQKYSTLLTTDTTSVNVSAIKSFGNSTLLFNGEPMTSGQNVNFNISNSAAEGIITVINSEVSTDYKIRVLRPAMLRNITVNRDLAGILLPLTKPFDQNIKTYSLKLVQKDTCITIRTSKINVNDTVEINGIDIPDSTYTAKLLNQIEDFYITVKGASRNESYILSVYQPFSKTVPKVSFDISKSENLESATSNKLKVALSHTPTQTITVNYAAVGGSAANGIDYTLNSGILTFAPCESEKEINLSVVDDNIAENDETIQIALTNALPLGQVELGNTTTYTYKIIDNDYPTVSFSTDVSQVNENAGSKTIAVSISQNPVKQLKVFYTVKGGTAGIKKDFNLTENLLVFRPSEPLTKYITVQILNNTKLEENKTVILELVNVENANYGDKIRHTMTIVDDEIDQTAPILKITSPTVNSTYTCRSSSITISGTAEDNMEVNEVSYILYGATTGQGIISGTSNWSINDLPLNVGTTNIKVSAKDNAGNTGSDTLTVNRSNCTNVLYVRENIDISGNGCAWNSAFKYLQDALIEARNSVGGVTEIRVAAGVYYPDKNSSNPNGTGVRTESFRMVDDVTILGGYPANGGEIRNSNPKTNETILSGDIDGNNNLDGNSYHVVIGSCGIMDGFTITAGHANDNNHSVDPFGGEGAGFLGNSISSIIKNCRFIQNQAYSGCGICVNNSNITIQKCVFDNNSNQYESSVEGGGIFTSNSNLTIEASTFSKNNLALGSSLENGAAIFQVGGVLNADRSVFDENGPCALMAQSGTVNLNNCNFVNNFSSPYSHGGGAIHIGTDVTSSDIKNCKFSNNSAPNGGALFFNYCSGNHTVVNTLFLNNESTYGGGAINVHSATGIILNNCTFSRNRSVGGIGGAIYNYDANTIVSNCILWHNSDLGMEYPDIFSAAGTMRMIAVNYCDIEYLQGFSGNNNFSIDPLFCSFPPVYYTDLRILSDNSPCVNSANESTSTSTDIDGNLRDDPDRGAYERISPTNN